MWNAYSSLSDAQTRQAFLRTLRSVVDHRGQSVSALNKLHLTLDLPTLLIWGANDGIIPVAHGYATHAALPGSRLEVLDGIGHFPHVEAPAAQCRAQRAHAREAGTLVDGDKLNVRQQRREPRLDAADDPGQPRSRPDALQCARD